MKTILITISGAVLALLVFAFTTSNKISIDGTWAVVEVQTVKQDGTFTAVYPKEGLAIFSKNYYSICWTSNDSKAVSWQVADSTKLNRFNQSIINTGSYSLKNTVLTTKALFAMNPMFTNGIATFDCSYNGDTLVLTGVNVVSKNNVVHPVYAAGSHIVTKLLRVSNK